MRLTVVDRLLLVVLALSGFVLLGGRARAIDNCDDYCRMRVQMIHFTGGGTKACLLYKESTCTICTQQGRCRPKSSDSPPQKLLCVEHKFGPGQMSQAWVDCSEVCTLGGNVQRVEAENGRVHPDLRDSDFVPCGAVYVCAEMIPNPGGGKLP